jgi:AcrR family transcriptional regulator
VKERIVLAAERMFAARGIEGVSLRQISVASGNANNSAVQYHFGTRDELLRAILEYRRPCIEERRSELMAERRPRDLPSMIECFVLPILEQGEREDSHYLSFVAMLLNHPERTLFSYDPPDFRNTTAQYLHNMAALLPPAVEPLAQLRLFWAIMFAVHATADRERARTAGRVVPPFAVYATGLIDGIVGFVQAPVSSRTQEAIRESGGIPSEMRRIPGLWLGET